MKKNEELFDFLKFEILGLLLIGSAVLILTTFFLEGDGFFYQLINRIYTLTGSSGIVFCSFLLWNMGFCIYRKEKIHEPYLKVLGFALLLISLLSLTEHWKSGGLIGYYLDQGFTRLFGHYGKLIVIATLMISSLLLVFEVLFSEIQLKVLNFWKQFFKFTDRKYDAEKTFEALLPIVADAHLEEETGEEIFEEPETENSEITPLDEILPAAGNESQPVYMPPPLELLTQKKKINLENSENIRKKGCLLIDSLKQFNIVASILNTTQGPAVTRYELQPAPGVKVARIVSLANDISLTLASSYIRIEAPIPGKSAIGIEVPNEIRESVGLREIIESNEFQKQDSPLTLGFGKGLGDNIVVWDLKQLPHALIAGATGSGKSVCINTIICSVIYKASPRDVKLILIDPKMVELNIYHDIPHLMTPVITDARDAAFALKWAVDEMERRYRLLSSLQFRNIESYNNYLEEKKAHDEEIELEKLPYIVIVIDELADLMMIAKDAVEQSVCRIAQKARAVGMHLVVATQRPSVDVVTGLIKANLPSRIAFSVTSQIDSRTIIDSKGAEKLLGKGDMLFMPIGSSKPIRVQGAFISENEVKKITDYLRKTGYPDYVSDVTQERSLEEKKGEGAFNPEYNGKDEFLDEAICLVVENKLASVSMLQRKLSVGHARAGRLMDIMEEMGIVSAQNGSKPRDILIDKSDLDNFVKKREEA
ncbi:MAG: DNA translocase FtsK [Candidatus Wallbacteria bacterium]|nr:DNA translocase FtsK [Candidatus Wallbacteria bacterium]